MVGRGAERHQQEFDVGVLAEHQQMIIGRAMHTLERTALLSGPLLYEPVLPATIEYADEPQASAMLRHRDHLADLVHRAQDVLDVRFAEPLPLDELARSLGVSPRTLNPPAVFPLPPSPSITNGLYPVPR